MNDQPSGKHPEQGQIHSQSTTGSQPGPSFNRRHFLGAAAGLAALSAGGAAYLLAPNQAHAASASQGRACIPTATTGNTIVFGDTSSETAARLQQVNSVVITNSLGIPARRCNPPSGSLIFTLPCDPVKQNYLTVRFWGSDLDPAGGQLALVSLNGTNLSPEYEYGQDHPEIDRLMPTAAFPGRFFYTTELLPLSLTTGQNQVTLTIESFGQASPYTPSQPVSPQTVNFDSKLSIFG